MPKRLEVYKERFDAVNDESQFGLHGSTRTRCSAEVKKFNYSKNFLQEEDFRLARQINSQIENGYLILEAEIDFYSNGIRSLNIDFFFEHNFFGRFLNVEAEGGFDFYF